MEVHDIFKTLRQEIHQVKQHRCSIHISLSCWGGATTPIPPVQQPVPNEHWVPYANVSAAPAVAGPQDWYVGRDLLGSSSPTLCICFISFSVEVPDSHIQDSLICITEFLSVSLYLPFFFFKHSFQLTDVHQEVGRRAWLFKSTNATVSLTGPSVTWNRQTRFKSDIG